MPDTDIVIASAVRTPIGAFNGGLASLPAHKLGEIAIAEVLRRANVAPNDVSEVILGQILAAGEGMNPARQASIGAGIPVETTAYSVNQVCGSGLRTVALGFQAIRNGDSEIVVAGGQESMSLAPHCIHLRNGVRMGDGQLVDTMINDGLWDPYNDMHMGNCGEICARDVNITRAEQDEYAIRSYKLANEAIDKGYYKEDIVEVSVPKGKETVVISEDEQPRKVKYEKIPTLKPVFDKNGTITAANASPVNDGAATRGGPQRSPSTFFRHGRLRAFNLIHRIERLRERG